MPFVDPTTADLKNSLKRFNQFAVHGLLFALICWSDVATGHEGGKRHLSSVPIDEEARVVEGAIKLYLNEIGETWSGNTTRLVGLETSQGSAAPNFLRLVIYHADSEEHLQALNFDCPLATASSCEFKVVQPRCFYVSQASDYSPEEIFEAWSANHAHTQLMSQSQRRRIEALTASRGHVARSAEATVIRVWQTYEGLGTRSHVSSASEPDRLNFGMCTRDPMNARSSLRLPWRANSGPLNLSSLGPVHRNPTRVFNPSFQSPAASSVLNCRDTKAPLVSEP
jgi:hypothetical protein